MRLPGVLGSIAPPPDDDIQRQLRDLQQQISDLVTATQVQNASTLLRSYNDSDTGVQFSSSYALVSSGTVQVPIACSSVLVHLVAVVDASAAGVGVEALVRMDSENTGDPGTLSPETFSSLSDTVTASYTRVLPGLDSGAYITVGAEVRAPNGGTGTVTLSGLVVFLA